MLRVRYRLCLIDIEREAPKFGSAWAGCDLRPTKLEINRQAAENMNTGHWQDSGLPASGRLTKSNVIGFELTFYVGRIQK